MRALGESYAGVSIPEGGWVDLERKYEESMDVDTPREDVFRFYFNLARKASNRAFDLRRFDELAAPGRRVGADEPCVLMFDGARTRDCAVLTAWALGDDDTLPHHFKVALWERPHNPDADYEHPRGEIKGAVRDFMRDRRCVLFAYDSSFHELSSMYDDWLDEYGDATDHGLVDGYPTASGKRMEAAVSRIREDLRAGAFTHDGDPTVREHVSNAVAARNRGGWLLLEHGYRQGEAVRALLHQAGFGPVATRRDLAGLERVSGGPYRLE
jgi:hypothetical protein